MALPDLTPEQRAQALEKATQARRRRAEVKNALKARSMNLSEVLELADLRLTIKSLEASRFSKGV